MQSSYQGKWLEYGVSAEELVDELLVFDEHTLCHTLMVHIINEGVRNNTRRWSYLTLWTSHDMGVPTWLIVPIIWTGLFISLIKPVHESFLNTLEGVDGNILPMWRRRLQVRKLCRMSIDYIMKLHKNASPNTWNYF